MFKPSVLKKKVGELEDKIFDLRTLQDIIIEERETLKKKNEELKRENKYLEREYDLKTEEKLNELRKEMQESLIKSDLLRTEALAKLEIYEKTDTKADANTIKEMVTKLISTIGKQNINVVK